MRSPLPLLASILVLAAVPAAAQTAAAGRARDSAALVTLKERDWPRAYRTQDAALLDRILADEFQVIRDDGERSTKRDELEYVRTTPPAYDSLVFRIERLDILENGTAIVAGTGLVHARRDGRPVRTEYKSTNVLIRRAGRWQAVASHTSGSRELAP